MSFLTLAAVAGIAWQSTSTFREHLTKEIEEATLQQAEASAADVSNTIDNWIAQIAVTLPTLRTVGNQSNDNSLQNFVQSNGEFVALQLFVIEGSDPKTLAAAGSALTTNMQDSRFEDRDAKGVLQQIPARTRSWLASRVGSTQSRTMLQNLSPATKLPMASLAIRFDVAGSKQSLWAVLTVWQTRLLNALPKSRFVESTVIDRSGRVFSSPVLREMLESGRLGDSPLVKSALAGRSPSGFENEFTGRGGKSWLGAYVRIPKHDGISLIVQRDAEQAYLVIRRNILESVLWACLFVLAAIATAFLGSSTITRSLREVTTATKRIASGDFSFRISPKSRDEVAVLSHSVNAMSSRITELLRSQVDKARFEKELETARTVQSTLFPKQDVVSGALTVSGHYQPASECGGDLWGHFRVREGVELVFIADAMGHGAPAALITAMAYSTCMTMADVLRDTPMASDSPSRLLERLNRIIFEAVRGQISMTFFVAVIDFRTGEMTCANAGHNFPVLIPKNESDTRGGKATKAIQKISKLRPLTLAVTGMPLGMGLNETYKEKKFRIEPGDKLILFTDGLIECTDSKGTAWGHSTMMQEILQFAPTCTPVELRDRILDRAFTFFSGHPIADDVTVVAAEIDPNWKPSERTSDGTPSDKKQFKVSLPVVS